jgi:hypothetical protein
MVSTIHTLPIHCYYLTLLNVTNSHAHKEERSVPTSSIHGRKVYIQVYYPLLYKPPSHSSQLRTFRLFTLFVSLCNNTSHDVGSLCDKFAKYEMRQSGGLLVNIGTFYINSGASDHLVSSQAMQRIRKGKYQRRAMERYMSTHWSRRKPGLCAISVAWQIVNDLNVAGLLTIGFDSG